MTGVPATAADQLLTGLTELRREAGSPSYTTLMRQAAAQQPPLAIRAQRLSDWFTGKAVPADPAVVRFLVDYLQPRAARTGRYQPRPAAWWLDLHREAVRQRQAGADERRRTADPPASPYRLGRPIDQCDPLALEVHPAIQLSETDAATDPLPGYVPRTHDTQLREVADQVLGGGSSRLVTLVGGSSTGKTRACWELARYLDARQPGRWWLWHPYDPTRPQAAMAALDHAGPFTIVWLNEAQQYLMLPDVGMGERVAAGLRSLLYDPVRGPVVVLATVWPQYWSALTTRPAAGGQDPYGQARELLAGTSIVVADTFSPGELAGLATEGVDPRVRQAAAHAEGGRIAQYLAGAPIVEERYHTAPPAARAIIQVAIDARRLGHPLAIPHALLEQAAPDYLDDHDWDSLGENWLEQALAYTASPCEGARGPLTRIRNRPGKPATDGVQPRYRLADYLEQVGSTERAGVYPPESLWTAFTSTVTDPDLLQQLGEQAEHRARYQHAVWLYTCAADRGSTAALQHLARLLDHAGDTVGATALAVRAADGGDTAALWDAAERREQARDTVGAEALYQQIVDRGNINAIWALAQLREHVGDIVGAEALYRQIADKGQAGAASRALAMLRMRVGDFDAANALLQEAADHDAASPPPDWTVLRKQAEDPTEVAPTYQVTETEALRRRAWQLEHAGDVVGAEALFQQAANRGDTGAMQGLAELRRRAGDVVGAESLLQQAVDRGGLAALWDLAELRDQAGDAASADEMRRFGLTGSRLDSCCYGLDPCWSTHVL